MILSQDKGEEVIQILTFHPEAIFQVLHVATNHQKNKFAPPKSIVTTPINACYDIFAVELYKNSPVLKL